MTLNFKEAMIPCYRLAPFLALALATACADADPVAVTDDATTLTVDASAGWAYVRLGETATEVDVADPAASTAWDIAFNATRVMLNGGAAGPGAVRGYCLCQNASATDAQVQAMTAAGEAGDFEAVTLASVPAEAGDWEVDALDPAIAGWYAYDFGTHEVRAVPDRVWQVRGAGEDPEYAKLRVTEVADATQAGARVTIEYAVQPAAGAPFGAVQTAVLDGRGDAIHFDLESGEVDGTGAWDLMLDGYDLRVNGGITGSGGAGAVLSDETFDALTDASAAPSQVYRGDAFGGVFTAEPWYRYNLDNNHTIFPTFDVYLIDTGSAVYKLQVTGYYSVTGEYRHITFRYELLES
jgi:hypothetical protein